MSSHRSRSAIGPSTWWWTLLRISGQLLTADRDTGDQPLGWVLLALCEYFARSTVLLPRPDPDWAHLVQTAEHRLKREEPEAPLDMEALFSDISHLCLRYPLSDRKGGRRRRAAPRVTSWWQRYWQ